MKNFYAAVGASEQRKDGTKGYYSFVECFSDSQNLCNFNFNAYEHVNLCETKKKAKELVEFWNNCYRKNGTYFFQNAPLF